MANQSNNASQTTSVTTKGYHTSNSDAIKATALDWNYYGEMLKIIISDELPENEQTEKRRYDYDHSWITCITRVKCLDLLNQFNNLIVPAIKEKTNKFVSVTVATVNQFGIGVMFDENGKMRTYVKLIRNISADNLTSNESIIYEFRKGEVIVDYTNETGKFGERIQEETELYLFMKDIDSFIKAGSKAFNHMNRVVDKTYKDMVSSDIRAIGAKVGAEVSTAYSAQKAGARYGQTSLFDNAAVSAPTEQINSLDELDMPFA